MKKDTIYRIAVTNSVAAQIVAQPSENIAYISFVDVFNNQPVTIPPGITLYNYTTGIYEDATTAASLSFVVCWTDQYVLKLWNQEILHIIRLNKRTRGFTLYAPLISEKITYL